MIKDNETTRLTLEYSSQLLKYARKKEGVLSETGRGQVRERERYLSQI